MRFSSFFIYLFSVLFPLHCVFLVDASATESSPFYQVEIEPLFHDLLVSHQDFMAEGGTRLFEDENGDLALIGIGKVFPEQTKNESIASLSRKGEIRARAATLEMGGDVEIQTFRGNSDSIAIGQRAASLSSFFQVTATKVEDKLQQLPVVGTWWSANQQTFYVAVGKIVRRPNGTEADWANNASPLLSHAPRGKEDSDALRQISGAERKKLRYDAEHRNEKNSEIASSSENSALLIEGEEPFVSILMALPLLVKNGGVRGVLLPDGRKALLAVANVPVQENKAKALRIARMKAIRSLLGHQEGIHVVSAEYLTDGEHLQLSESDEQYFSTSEFLSVQKEHVSGRITALPWWLSGRMKRVR